MPVALGPIAATAPSSSIRRRPVTKTRALRREAFGRREADAAGAAGDDGDFSFEFSYHDLSPCWRDKSEAAGYSAKEKGLKCIIAEMKKSRLLRSAPFCGRFPTDHHVRPPSRIRQLSDQEL
jgi:hypothetical protein